MTYRMDHIALLVRDLEAEVAFLTGVIGLTEGVNPMGGTTIRWIEIGDGRRFHVQAGDVSRVHAWQVLNHAGRHSCHYRQVSNSPLVNNGAGCGVGRVDREGLARDSDLLTRGAQFQRHIDRQPGPVSFENFLWSAALEGGSIVQVTTLNEAGGRAEIAVSVAFETTGDSNAEPLGLRVQLHSGFAKWVVDGIGYL